MSNIRNRITEIRKMRLGDVAQGPDNWRLHPESQVAAFLGLIEEVGWFGVPLIYWSEKENSWAYLDGNMRGENLPDFEADVAVTDFTDEDIAEPLTTYDPLAAAASANREKLGALLQRTRSGNEGVQALLAGLAERELGIFEEGQDPWEEWQGMPEFEQEDLLGIQVIKVHFETREAVEEFEKLIDQSLQETTKDIWYPEHKPQPRPTMVTLDDKL